MTNRTTALAAACFALIAIASVASADMILGDKIGVFDGNDNALVVATNAGVTDPLMQLGKIDMPDGGLDVGDVLTNGNFSLTVGTLKDRDSDMLTGQWSYSGPSDVQFLVVKASNQYILFDYSADLGLTNSGSFANTDIFRGKHHLAGISHVTIYGGSTPPTTPVPEPASLTLGLLGMGLVLKRRRRKAA